MIVEAAAADSGREIPSLKKIGDFYNAFTDEGRVEELGTRPIAGYLAQIDSLESHSDIVSFLGSSNPAGWTAPLTSMWAKMIKRRPAISCTCSSPAWTI